jgi:hypothetical protein
VPADGHHGCQLQEHGDFGTSPPFRQLFDKPLLAYMRTMGVPEIKNNRRNPLLCYCAD